MPRPFRFGIQLALARSAAEWRAAAARAESAGYDVLLMPDHFGSQLSPLPALAAAAAATATLRVGTLVACNDFPHPLVLAKEAATLDLLSDGRFELGIGAGWDASDYTETGIRFDDPGVRVARLKEAIERLRDSPHVWIGTVDAIVDRLRGWRERLGISYYTILGDLELLEAGAPIVAALAGT